MRVLIETDWADIIDDFSSEQKLEIFDCILHYPDKSCDIKSWNFIKKQIERDQTTYQNRCKGMSVGRKSRWTQPENKSEQITKQSEQIENKSDDFLSGQSEAIAKSDNNTNFNNKTNCKNDVSAMIARLANNLNINAEAKYEIYHDFSFAELVRRDRVLGEMLSSYPEQVLVKTQQALIRKCLGKKMEMSSILKWLDEQLKYYKEQQ